MKISRSVIMLCITTAVLIWTAVFFTTSSSISDSREEDAASPAIKKSATPNSSPRTEMPRSAFREKSEILSSEFRANAEAFMARKPLPETVAPDWINGLQALIVEWAKVDPEGALDYIATLGDIELEECSIESVFEGYGFVESDKAFALARRLEEEGRGNLSVNFRWIVSSQILAGRYEEMVDAISAITEPEIKAVIYDFAFYNWSRNDPESLAASLAIYDDKSAAMLRAELTAQWVTQDPVSAVRYASSLEHGEERANAYLNLVDSWVKEDFSEVSQWLREQGHDSDLDIAVSSYAQYVDLAVYEATDVIDWALSITDPIHRNRAIEGVVGNWAMVDPQRAFEWALSDQGTASAALRAITSMKESAPEMIKDSAELLATKEPIYAGEAYAHIVEYYAEEAQAEYINHIISILPDDKERDDLLNRSLDILTLHHADLVSENIDQMEAGKLKDELRDRFVKRWAYEDIESALIYADSAEDPEIRQSGVSATVNIWLDRDYDKAIQWLDDQPTDALYDKSIESVVSRLSERKPQEAKMWLNKLSDPNLEDELRDFYFGDRL